MEKKNYGYINALKGIAILAVTLVHTGASELSGIPGRIGSDCARGVQLFFLISGMLAFKSLYSFFPDRKITIKGVLNWYLKKLSRLVPLYYLAIIISMTTGSWHSYWLGSEGHVTVKNILAHVFLLHGFFPHYTDSVLGVEWYLGVLWLFFLITPLLFWIIDSLEKSICFAILIYILNPLVNSKLALVLPTASDSYIYDAYIEDFGPLSQFLIYIFGIILFYFVEQLYEKNIKHRKLLSFSILAFALILLYGQVNGASNLYRFSRHEMFGIYFSLIIISQTIYSTKIICNPIFELLGEYSYGIYLFQFIWLNIYNRFIHYNGRYDWLIRFVVSVLALFIIAFVSNKFFEKPIQKITGKIKI